MTFDELLADVDEELQEVAHAARLLVRGIAPRAEERVEPSWGGYLLFQSGGVTVCFLSAHQRHVSLGFSQGTSLPDPEGLLQGSGKNQRHVKLRALEDVPRVRGLVEAAWAGQPDPAVVSAALERVREICLGLPGTSEKSSHGHPTFFAGRKSFAVFGLYSASVAFKAGLEQAGDPRFFPTPYMAHQGWLSLRVDGGTDWDEVRGLLEDSYRRVAPRRLL